MSFNDPQWGRSAGSDKPRNDEQENQQRQDQNQPDPNDENNRREEADRQASDNDRNNMSDRRGNRNEGNDLDQLWNDFNRMVNSILGGQKDPRGNRQSQDAWQSRRDDETPREEEQPAWRQDDHQTPPPPRTPRARRGFGRDPKSFSVRGIAGLIGVAAIAWLASGIYIVPEGQIGVVTTFGKYTQDSAPGINWRLPWPVQDVEIVDVSSVRKAEIGMRGTTQRLKEALMLTDDENIVDVMFNVQYRIKPHAAKDYLFRSRDPDRSVFDAAESAMREVVGRKTMDSVLFESKQEIASAVQVAMQAMLDRYQTGIEVMSVAIQNAQPPQQVQAAFNDAVKAGQDRESQDICFIQKPVTAKKYLIDKFGYKKGDFIDILTGKKWGELEQYEKAPQVTRDRIYIDAMRDVYSNTKKVLVESKGASNLLYLPFDKLLEQSASAAKTQAQNNAAAGTAVTAAPTAQSSPQPEASRTLSRERIR